MNDTIVAIATGMGNSGIGIIRLSGDKALEIAGKVFKPNNQNKTIDKHFKKIELLQEKKEYVKQFLNNKNKG